MKRVLMAATVPSMIGQFNMENIRLLLNMGYKVDVACDFNDTSVWPKERTQKLKKELAGMDVNCIQLDFSRNPINIKSHISSYRKAVNILKKGKYDFIHTHTPIASSIVRIAAHTAHTKVIYTAHGFHFYEGGPLKNWLLFYPIEKFLSRWTDVLITINKEDYHRAKTRFYAAKTVYIPGVGVDIGKFSVCQINRSQKRRSLGLKEDDFVLLSVGELSERKNQKIVIEALHKMAEKGAIANIVYLVVGRGEMQESLDGLISVYGLKEHVKLAGFRSDIDELCEIADCFVHPSVREGLGIAPLEAMAAGLPMISADVNGIKDYTKDKVTGCCIDPTDVDQMVLAIKKMHEDEDFRKKCIANNLRIAKKFDIRNLKDIMSEIYQGGGYKHLKAVLLRQKKREELGVGLDDFCILSVGELNVNKNHQVIIRALKEMDDLKTKYFIAGKGEQKKKLDKLIKELGLSGKVKLLGFRRDIPELLRASDCFAFPSRREGLGIAAVEAMAAGVPLVTSASGGIKDYCISGITGYLSKKGTAEEYKSLLEQVKNCDEIQPANLKKYSSKFNENCVRKIMQSIYKGI